MKSKQSATKKKGLSMKIFLTMFMLVLFSSTTFAQDEEIELTTYYPAPYGDYDFLSANSVAIGTNAVQSGFKLDVEGATLSRTYIMKMKQNPDLATDTITDYVWGIFPSESTGRLVVGYRTDNTPLPGMLEAGPLTIEFLAPNYAFNIDKNGKVGVGTTTPFSALHVAGSHISAEDGIYVSGVGGNNQIAWRTNMTAAGLQPNAIKMDPTTYDMQFFTGGQHHMTLTTGGQLRLSLNVVDGAGTPPDYLFEKAYNLESIEDHAKLMWDNKCLPSVGNTDISEDGSYSISLAKDRNSMLEELEKAHIYIEQLHKRVKVLEAKLSKEES